MMETTTKASVMVTNTYNHVDTKVRHIAGRGTHGEVSALLKKNNINYSYVTIYHVAEGDNAHSTAYYRIEFNQKTDPEDVAFLILSGKINRILEPLLNK